MAEPAGGGACSLPREIREQLAELELELSEGDITQKGYEKKRAKLLAPYIPQTHGVDPALQKEPRNQTPAPAATSAPSSSKYHRARSGGARDERYRSDIHTEAVQAALAKHKEQKMALPMPTKRRSTFVQSPADACTPPDTSSASEDEGSLRRQAALSAALHQSLQNAESWINRSIQGSSTSSSASSTLSHGEGKGTSGTLADVFANTRIENFSVPPDVTATTSSSSSSARPATIDLPPSEIVKGTHKGSNRSSLMDTADGVPVSSRVSTKIQQLLNTLKRPKRPPLKEFFVDDFEEIVEVPQPDPNQPKPEGRHMTPVKGEPLGVICNWPPALEAALQRWGTTQAKCPCLTALDVTGKPVYTLTYGKLWSRSLKLAYTLLNKLGTKNEPVLKPGDRVALVYPNNDPVMFMVAFYGCLLAEVIPVPIEVPLTRKDAGGQQIGFLLGSCGITLALTTEVCLKGLPKTQNGEIVQFKGWPRLKWVVTDSKYLSKSPKDWQPNISTAGTEPAYIEYKTSKEGSVMGVTVSRIAMLSHCQALSQACNYSEGETIVNVLDFKKDAGLWHGMLTNVMNKLHTLSVPYSVMKTCPLSWVQRIHTHKAKVALVKCRDLHWAMMAHRDQRDVSLSSLRMLIVTDGANPWSVSSCDAFLSLFQSHGLKPEAICPCATSPEAMTVAIRRPGVPGAPLPGRAILSMNGLSYGVIRVNTEDKNSALTVQDVGHVMPGGMMCIVKPDGSPQLCKTDEIGEICVSSKTGGMMYYGLAGVTKNTFEVIPVNSAGSPVGDLPFVRSGLLGFVGPGSLVFVVGKMDGLLTVSGRRHNADDIVATGLAVESIKTVYRGRIAVFSVSVFYDERIVVVAEQRPDASEEDSFQWMSRVLQAIDSIHQVGVYCLALVPANTLPKTPLGGIHISQTKQHFLEGSLHPCNILMCPHTCVTNLPKPRQKQPGVGPASVMVGNLVAGKRIAQAAGRDLGQIEDNDLVRKHQFLTEVLQWRAQATPDHMLFLLLNAKGTPVCTATCLQLHKRAERIASVLYDKGHLNAGDNVVLLYPPGIELIAAFYGCLYAGCIPVTVRPPHAQNLTATLPTVRMIVDVSKAACILTTQTLMRLLKSREAAAAVDVKTWPTIIDTDDLPRKRLPQLYKPPTPEMLAYLDFSVSTTGMLTGVKMSHAAVNALCRAIKLQCELYSSRQVAICLDPYCGLGFTLWCLCSVYSGHQSILIPPMELESNLFLWLSTVSQYKIRDTFCSYSVMELCTKGLGNQVEMLKARGINLSCVRTCVVVAEERPRISLTQSFSKLFKDIGLSSRAVSTTFGSRVNVAICLQGTSGPDPTTVYVDLKSLRHDRVRLVERGAPQSLLLSESGKVISHPLPNGLAHRACDQVCLSFRNVLYVNFLSLRTPRTSSRPASPLAYVPIYQPVSPCIASRVRTPRTSPSRPASPLAYVPLTPAVSPGIALSPRFALHRLSRTYSSHQLVTPCITSRVRTPRTSSFCPASPLAYIPLAPPRLALHRLSPPVALYRHSRMYPSHQPFSLCIASRVRTPSTSSCRPASPLAYVPLAPARFALHSLSPRLALHRLTRTYASHQLLSPCIASRPLAYVPLTPALLALHRLSRTYPSHQPVLPCIASRLLSPCIASRVRTPRTSPSRPALPLAYEPLAPAHFALHRLSRTYPSHHPISPCIASRLLSPCIASRLRTARTSPSRPASPDAYVPLAPARDALHRLTRTYPSHQPISPCIASRPVSPCIASRVRTPRPSPSRPASPPTYVPLAPARLALHRFTPFDALHRLSRMYSSHQRVTPCITYGVRTPRASM
ncbi:disco-interacting protein 2 homolog B [Dermochelys coriacea]|uniref:disco-interacting protein 2 homolog B n=1 Tax=Dermochelys coriacea TaxID=27794 RepID=UPI0018E9025F|nr:disco-interacting protein 2 homolog B [Dermochelys coriacea]